MRLDCCTSMYEYQQGKGTSAIYCCCRRCSIQFSHLGIRVERAECCEDNTHCSCCGCVNARSYATYCCCVMMTATSPSLTILCGVAAECPSTYQRCGGKGHRYGRRQTLGGGRTERGEGPSARTRVQFDYSSTRTYEERVRGVKPGQACCVRGTAAVQQY